MSHVVSIKLEIKDPDAIRAAVGRCKDAVLLKNGEITSHRLWSGQNKTGIGVQLPNWNHPVVMDPETGEVHYDNFGGRWGEQLRLDEFVQAYSIEKVRMQAAMHGHQVSEEVEENGDVRLTINSYGS